MAHVAKRPRLHGPKNPTLTLPATTTPKLRNLQIEHENSLRQSAQRLKTSWEDICRRYGRDFDGEGDEIDLRTGEVVIDNGHLRGLEEDLEDTWGGGDEDEEGDDAGSATSSLEMEILARRPMLARDEMGGPMLRDDEAEEIDVDEDLDRDAIDDLFDELELATGFSGKEKRRREKDQRSQETQGSIQKEQIGQDSIPSPASSEPAEDEESTAEPSVRELGKDSGTAASPDELLPDDIMLEYVTKLGRERLLALVQTLQSTEIHGDTADPGIVAQLTPVSECGKPLSEQLEEAVEKLTASKDPALELPDVEDALDPEVEQVSVEGKEDDELEPIRDPEPPAPIELLAELVEAAEDTQEVGVEPPSLPLSETAIEENHINAISSTEATINTLPTLPQREWDFTVDLDSDSEPVPVDQNPPEEQPTEHVLEAEPSTASKPSEENQPPIMENQEQNPDFHYGDIDDLSTIIVPKTSVPVTPKNRLHGIKSSGSLRKALSTKKQGRRRLSEIGTPNRVRNPSSSKRKPPQTVPSKPHTFLNSPDSSRPKSAGSKKARNFWSALPGDPFYDPKWQDSHPDGEPAFEEFERRRILLEEHATNGIKQKETIDDDLMILDSPPVRKKKTPKAKSQGTPKTREPRTPMSKRVKYEDEVEKKLHTPRSGKFLEYLKKKAAEEKDSAKKGIAAGGPSGAITGAASADLNSNDGSAATPTRKAKNEDRLSDSEEEESPFVRDRGSQKSGAQKQKRARGRPRKAPVPLIAPDPPTSSSKRAIFEEDSTSTPLAKCGDTGYRCKKALCFKCVDE
ncbi:hypothetical protein TWF281_007225 [Arthrobotrys megalospora]